MTRELRSLAPVEAAVVVTIALVPWPDALPLAVPLVIAATASRWLRGRGFAELVHGRRGVLVGLIAGLAAVAIAAPAWRGFGVSAIEWWMVPATHGDLAQLVLVIVVVLVTSIALELALRGWLVERVLELSPGPTTFPIVVGALAELLVVPGPLAARLGIALFGIGLGLLYVGSGRNLLASIAARSVFAVGAVLAQAVGVV